MSGLKRKKELEIIIPEKRKELLEDAKSISSVKASNDLSYINHLQKTVLELKEYIEEYIIQTTSGK